MEKRNAKIKADKDMLLQMDPEIAEIFKASQSVSGKYLSNQLVLSIPLPTISYLLCLWPI